MSARAATVALRQRSLRLHPAALLLCLLTLGAGPLQAADTPTAKAPGQKAATKAPRSDSRPTGPAKAGTHATAPAGGDEELSAGQAIYQILVGEFASLSGQGDLALSAYADTARRSHDPQALARTVDLAIQARQFEMAQAAAALWLAAEPESVKARESLVGSWLMLQRPEAAEPHLAILLAGEKDQPEKLRDNLLRINRLFAGLQDKQAIPGMVDRLTAPYLDYAEAHYARAQAAFTARQFPAALQAMEQAERLRPNWEEAVLFEAQILARANRNTDAVDRLRNYLGRYPDARDSRLMLARILVSVRDYPNARRELERLTAADGDDRDALYPLAVLYLQTGDNATSERLFKHLLTLGHPDRQAIQYFLGRITEEGQRPHEARQWYEQVTYGEHYLNARKRLAQLQLQQGQLDDALSTLRSSRLQGKGDRVQLLLAEAQLLRSAERPQQAYDLLEQALRQYPDNPLLTYDLALQAERTGRLERMETLLQRLIEKDPDNAQALNALGYSLADRNLRLDEARTLIERALQLEPDEAAILDSMGWVLYRQNDLQGALAYLQRAYQLSPEADIGQHLGDVLWQLGKPQEARKVWQDALKHNPGNAPLQEALQRPLP